MELTRKQAIGLKRCNKRITLWHGAVRSAKTVGSLWDFIRVMKWRAEHPEQARGEVLLAGRSTNTVWRNLISPMYTEEMFREIAPHLSYRRNAPTGTLFGQEFSVVGAGTEASALSIQGMTLAYCLGDEAVTWTRSFFDMLKSRLSVKGARMLLTCNPGTSRHFIKTEIIDKAAEDPEHIQVERFYLSDNPTLDPDYIEWVTSTYSGAFYRRMILGEWCAAEGAVYEAWAPETMTVSPMNMPKLAQILAVGIDYGTNHPTAGYCLALGEDGRLYVTDEWSPNLATGTHRRLTDSQLADDLERWLSTFPLPPRFIYCDPAAASFREELRMRRIVTYKADNAVVDGIRTVDSLLVNRQLLIADTCTHLITEMGEYRWDEKATERGKDAPIKENDDHCDALRYAVKSSDKFWRPLLAQLESEVSNGV